MNNVGAVIVISNYKVKNFKISILYFSCIGYYKLKHLG